MARELTLADLEDAGVTWRDGRQMSEERIERMLAAPRRAERETVQLFEQHFDRAMELRDLGRTARRFRYQRKKR